MKNTIVFIVVLMLLCCVTAYAGGFGPEAGVLAKATFGNNGQLTSDVVTPVESSYNPAVIPMALQLFQEKSYLEFDYGHFNFEDGPDVETTWQYVAFQPDKKSGMRVARYDIRSGFAPTAAFDHAITTAFKGQTYELAYGRFVAPKLSLGAEVITEKVNTYVRFLGEQVADLEAKSKFNYRLGALYLVDKNTQVGVTYANDAIRGAATPVVEGESVRDYRELADFTESIWTVGVGWQLARGTYGAVNYQRGSLKGHGLDDQFDLMNYSLKQYLNPKVCLTLGYSKGSSTYGVQYSDEGTTLGASFTNNGFHQVRSAIGEADSIYLWAGRSF